MRLLTLTLVGLWVFAGPVLAQTTCNVGDKNTEAELSKIEGIRGGEFGAVRRDQFRRGAAQIC